MLGIRRYGLQGRKNRLTYGIEADTRATDAGEQ